MTSKRQYGNGTLGEAGLTNDRPFHISQYTAGEWLIIGMAVVAVLGILGSIIRGVG